MEGRADIRSSKRASIAVEEGTVAAGEMQNAPPVRAGRKQCKKEDSG